MNTEFDPLFADMEWFRIHRQLTPFVGDNYGKYRILHIGDSHYLSKTDDSDGYDINYFFNNWWTLPCTEIFQKFPGCVETRGQLENYLRGRRCPLHKIFNNAVMAFEEVFYGKQLMNVKPEDKQMYNYFAFMNFFQMPSLYKGVRYRDSLIKSARLGGCLRTADRVYGKCLSVSTETVDQVIDILDPDLVIFTSIAAARAYKEKGGQYADSPDLIVTACPDGAYWKKPLNTLGGKSGKYVFERALGLKYIEGYAEAHPETDPEDEAIINAALAGDTSDNAADNTAEREETASDAAENDMDNTADNGEE